MENSEGRIFSGYGGFYQVRLADGAIVNCKPRGKLKKSFERIYVGDQVEISHLPDNTGMIETIYPRRCFLPRPNIVNATRLLIVAAWKMPEYDLLLLDRMLVIAQKCGIEPIICFNKMDLLLPEEEEKFAAIAAVYQKTGFPLLAISTYTKKGLTELRQYLGHGTSVMAGQSGVGKTSLLNCLLPEEHAETGVVSERLKRGKHTTRYTRILPLDDVEEGFIADTPGFFILELPDDFCAKELASYYPDFAQEELCRFETCLHDKEPDCAVKAAVEAGEIDSGRYSRYLRLLQEIQEKEVQYR